MGGKTSSFIILDEMVLNTVVHDVHDEKILLESLEMAAVDLKNIFSLSKLAILLHTCAYD